MKTIQLTKGYSVLVDDEDYEKLIKYKWYAHICNGLIYAATRSIKDLKFVYMHRYIMNCTKGFVVDHITGNTLDNQKNNLRSCTQKQNIRNRVGNKNTSSKYIGVSWNKTHKKWSTETRKDKIKIFIGYFDNENDAAEAYNKKCLELYGEYFKPNIIN